MYLAGIGNEQQRQMKAIELLISGLCAIFAAPSSKPDQGAEWAKSYLEQYKRTSDRQRLAGDWNTVKGDMGRAWKKILSD